MAEIEITEEMRKVGLLAFFNCNTDDICDALSAVFRAMLAASKPKLRTWKYGCLERHTVIAREVLCESPIVSGAFAHDGSFACLYESPAGFLRAHPEAVEVTEGAEPA